MNSVGDYGINCQNYKNLVVAIIWQACRDYGCLLRALKKHGQEGLKQAEIKFGSKAAIEYFFNSNGPYFSYAEIDGPTLLKQMRKNFKLYNRTVLSDEDWDKVKENKHDIISK